MSDAGMPRERFGFQPGFEIFQFAFGAAALETLALQGGYPCGIVTAVFEPLERFHQLLRDRTASENADNAAHADQYLQIVEKFLDQRVYLLTRIAGSQILNNYCRLRQGPKA
jgi:hypothetical protein